MAGRTGRADLPLHTGHVPSWLRVRMAALGRIVVEALVVSYGRDEVLRRLSHPFWFQSLGAVMGMDWHSSGITTSVLSALKRGLEPVAQELGLFVLGGRGRFSRRTPDEIRSVCEQLGLDGDQLCRVSRLVAKVDNAAVQDGFQIYQHNFILAADGRWTVVQQGMCTERKTARRYHWLSEGLASFVDDPHAGIEGAEDRGVIINLADRRAERSRQAQLALIGSGPDHVANALREVLPSLREVLPSMESAQAHQPHLFLPHRHEVREEDVVSRRLWGTLAAAAAADPRSFDDLLLVPGVGERTLASLALVSEVVHGAPCRFSDPARFSLAHGGKDGHPFPVPLVVYDQTLTVYRRALEAAKLGNQEKLEALRRLDREARRAEVWATGPSIETFIHEEHHRSFALGGRTVFGPAARSSAVSPTPMQRARVRKKVSSKGSSKQLGLPLRLA